MENSDQKPVGIAQLINTEMPPVTVAETPAPATAPQASPSPIVEKDALGRPFNPSIFKRAKDSIGRWINLRAGRKGSKPKPGSQESFIPEEKKPAAVSGSPDTSPATPQAAPVASDEPAKPSLPAPDRFDLLADVYCRAAIAGAMGIMSEEWAPDDDAEYIGIRNSAAAYLRATNREDLSPGWALVITGVTYAAKRLPRPKTQSRLAYFKGKVSAWWKGRQIANTTASLPSP